MVDETLKYFKKNIGTSAIILLTAGTKKAKVYEKYAEKHSI